MALVKRYEDEGTRLELIEMWHPIKGKWHHCTQITNLDTLTVEFYTDGVLVHKCDKDSYGAQVPED